MKTIDETRRINLQTLIAEFGGVGALAERVGHKNNTQISQWRNASVDQKTGKPRVISSESARLLESVCNKPLGWMDNLHGLPNTQPAPPLSRVPLINWVQAGHWTDVVDTLPPGEGDRIETSYRARRHTFAVRVRGDSMQPRFPEGCIIVVEPDEQALPGKFVIVRQNGDSEATFKQLIQDGGTLYLKPINDRYPIMQMRDDAVIVGVVKQMVMDV